MWSFFSAIMGADFSNQYLDYAQGYNLTNRMPLWVKPDKKINITEAFQYMRNHFEASWLDMQQDVGLFLYMLQESFPSYFVIVGAGAEVAPYRWRPMTWTSGFIYF